MKPFFYQLKWLLNRNIIFVKREPLAAKAKFAQVIFIGFLVAALYWKAFGFGNI